MDQGDRAASIGTLFLKALVAFVVFAGVSSIANTFLVTDPGTTAGMEQTSIGMCVGAFAVIVLSGLWPCGASWRPRRLLSTVGLYALFMCVWVLVIAQVYPWLLQRLEVPLEPQQALDYFTKPPHHQWGRWVVVVAACVFGPIGEEIVFRGYLQTAFKRVLPVGTAVLVTSILFGLIHGPLYAFPVAMLGLFFGWMRERSGNMIAPILAHCLHNSLTIAVSVGSPELYERIFPQ